MAAALRDSEFGLAAIVFASEDHRNKTMMLEMLDFPGLRPAIAFFGISLRYESSTIGLNMGATERTSKLNMRGLRDRNLTKLAIFANLIVDLRGQRSVNIVVRSIRVV
jgi:hypothetical protein